VAEKVLTVFSGIPADAGGNGGGLVDAAGGEPVKLLLIVF
jgi:hypothetical protein